MAVFLGRESSTPQCMALALEPSKPLLNSEKPARPLQVQLPPESTGLSQA